MRTKNIKITMEIPVELNKPDLNGYIYTKDNLEKAVKKVKDKSLPIIIYNNENEAVDIGAATDACLTEVNNETKIIVSGLLFYGGFCEDCVCKSLIDVCKEIKQIKGIITDTEITAFGIAME